MGVSKNIYDFLFAQYSEVFELMFILQSSVRTKRNDNLIRNCKPARVQNNGTIDLISKSFSTFRLLYFFLCQNRQSSKKTGERTKDGKKEDCISIIGDVKKSKKKTAPRESRGSQRVGAALPEIALSRLFINDGQFSESLFLWNRKTLLFKTVLV